MVASSTLTVRNYCDGDQSYELLPGSGAARRSLTASAYFMQRAGDVGLSPPGGFNDLWSIYCGLSPCKAIMPRLRVA